jgi:putative transposase
MKFQFIDTQRTQHPLGRLCGALAVSRSGYYAWCQRPTSARAQANARVVTAMRALHQQTKARYGAIKMWHALNAAGIVCGRHRVARLRRMEGLVACRIRRFWLRIERQPFSAPAPNVLQQVFVAPAPNRIWVGDLTAIATRAGWLHLAVVLDLYSRSVVGWAMSAKPDQQLALAALRMAIARRQPRPGVIHHTDQGAQYASGTYQRLLNRWRLIPSMSRKGNCYDNAVVESSSAR